MNPTDRRNRQTRTDRQQTQTDRQQTQTHGDRLDSRPSERSRPKTTMADVSHTHPHAGRGAVIRPFQRGPVVAADGGERESYDASEADDEATEEVEEVKEAEETERVRMKDIDHTPPYGDGVDRVFERGGTEEPVQSEE